LRRIHGIETKVGSGETSVGDLLKPIVSIAQKYIDVEHTSLLDPLIYVLENNLPDSEFLKAIELQMDGDWRRLSKGFASGTMLSRWQ